MINFLRFTAFNGIIRYRTEKPLMALVLMRIQGSLQGKWCHEKEQRSFTRIDWLKIQSTLNSEELFKTILVQDKEKSAAFTAFPQRHAGSKQSGDARSPLKRGSLSASQPAHVTC